MRYLTNSSSGAMGIALAQEALRLGARVTLVLGPVPSPEPQVKRGSRPSGLKTVHVISGWDMYQAVKKHLSGTEVFVGSAAVVDYRPASPLRQKIKRHKEAVTLKLYGNPDIIAMVGYLRKARPRCVVGFALETDHMLENAQQKLIRKRMDWIVANRESNMGQSQGAGTLLSRWGDRLDLKKMSKDRLARKIWQKILSSR